MISNGKLWDWKSRQIERQHFEMLREGIGQRRDCRIDIENQKTKMDRPIPKTVIITSGGHREAAYK